MRRITRLYNFRQLKIAAVVVLSILACFFLFSIIGHFTSSAGSLKNGAALTENGQLTYRITVKGQGDNNQITVSDPLPLGLEYVDAQVVASDSCGEVTNLRYSDYQRVLNFKVINLREGCTQSVDLIVKVPELGTNIRKDFYNIVSATDGINSIKSDPVNAFLGQADATLYKVTYAYDGETPENAPAAPVTLAYSEGDSVVVAATPQLDGYDFDGWYTSDTVVTNGTFTIGNNAVSFSGSFLTDASAIVGATKTEQGSNPAKHIILAIVAIILVAAVIVGAIIAGRHGLGKAYYISISAVFAIAIATFALQYVNSKPAVAEPATAKTPFSVEIQMLTE